MDQVSDQLDRAYHDRADDESLRNKRVTALSGHQRDKRGYGGVAEKDAKAQDPIEQGPLGHARACHCDNEPEYQHGAEAADAPEHGLRKQLQEANAARK